MFDFGIIWIDFIMHINQTNKGKNGIRKIQDFFETLSKREKIIIPVAFFGFAFFGWLYGYESALHLHFNGRIQKIRYDGLKREPYITIKGVEYELGYSRWINYKETPEVGDSAIKKAGTTDFLLVKRK